MEFIVKHKKIIFWQLLLFTLTLLIYSGSLRAVFMFGDDQNMIINNVYLRDWKYFPRFFSESFFSGSGTPSDFWRPFQLMTYSLIVHMVGVKPWAIHLSSILFHAFNSVLIFTLFYLLLAKTVKPAIIAFTVAIWSLHPMHVEELGGISGLASPGYLFWMLFGIFAFMMFEKKKCFSWYLLALGGYTFALFSKESAVIFPGLLLAMHIAGTRTGLFSKLRPKDYIFKHLAFWLLALFYVVARLTFLNFGNTLNFYSQANIYTQNLYYRIFTLATALTHGLRIIFLPWALHPERSWPVFTSLFFPQVYLSILVLTTLLIAAIIAWKKIPLFSLGIFWFFFSYLPMSNIVAKINSLVCDHWFYASSVGIFLSVATLLALIKNNFFQKIVLWLLIFTIVVFSSITLSLIPHYKNSKAYCRYVLIYEPDSARTWNNLAMNLTEPEEEEEAINAYLKAIELSDIYPQTHNNLANTYLNLGKYDLAEHEFLEAIRLDKNFYRAYLGLGNIYLLQGKTQEAIYNFKKAMEIYPYLPNQTVNFINQLENQYNLKQ